MAEVTDEAADHPAPFSGVILDHLAAIVDAEVARRALPRPLHVLDPFAGVGGIHALASAKVATVGLELEREWADQHEHTVCGDVMNVGVLFGDVRFDLVVTSPCYGNRMADSHEAAERCSRCGGSGGTCILIHDGSEHSREACHGAQWRDCEACDGKGTRDHRRITYTHVLGRKLTDGNAGAMQWGPKYEAFHGAAWARVVPLLVPDGRLVLNISDHYRDGDLQPVTLWHVEALRRVGMRVVDWRKVPTPRMGFGANGQLRPDHESIITFERAS